MRKFVIILFILITPIFVFAQRTVKGGVWQTQFNGNSVSEKTPFQISFKEDGSIVMLQFKRDGVISFDNTVVLYGKYKEETNKITLKIYSGKDTSNYKTIEYYLGWMNDDEIYLFGDELKGLQLNRFNTEKDIFSKEHTSKYVEWLIKSDKPLIPEVLEELASPYRHIAGKCYKLKDGSLAPYLAFQFMSDTSCCRVIVAKDFEGLVIENKHYFEGNKNLIIRNDTKLNDDRWSNDTYQIKWLNSKEFLLIKGDILYNYIQSDIAKYLFEHNQDHI